MEKYWSVCTWYAKQILSIFDDQPSKHLNFLAKLFWSLPRGSYKPIFLVGNCGGLQRVFFVVHFLQHLLLLWLSEPEV